MKSFTYRRVKYLLPTIVWMTMFTLVYTACSQHESSENVAALHSDESAAVEPKAPITAAQAIQNSIDYTSLKHGFEFSGLDGRMRVASEWEGKVLLVNFWATWCVPCLKEMPVLSALQDKYAERGFEVIGIAADELENINAFLVKTPVSYPVLYGDSDAVFATSAQYGNPISVLPHTAFVGRDGKVHHSKIGELHYEEAEQLLLELL